MLNAAMKKKICERIVERLKKEGFEPTQENVRDAFFFLQPICVPDGFRVTHAGYLDIERGIRISVSRRMGDTRREAVEAEEQQEKEDLLAKVIETNKVLAEQFIVLQKQVAQLTDIIREFTGKVESKVPESLLPPPADRQSTPENEKIEGLHVGKVRPEDVSHLGGSRSVRSESGESLRPADHLLNSGTRPLEGSGLELTSGISTLSDKPASGKHGEHRSPHIRTPQFGGRRVTIERRHDARLEGDRDNTAVAGVELGRHPELRENGQTIKVTPIKPEAPKAPKPRPIETPTPVKCQKELEDGKPSVYFMGVPFNMRPEVAKLATVFEARFVDSNFSIAVLEKKLKQTKSAAVQMGRLGLKELSMSKAAKDAACFYVQDERPATPDTLADAIKKVEAHLLGCRG